MNECKDLLSESLKDVCRNVTKRQTQSEDDYIGENGLLYCGKCHTPKQTLLTLIDDVPRKLPILCACSDKKAKAENLEEERGEQQKKIDVLRREAFPTVSMRQWNFDMDDKKDARISNAMRRYIEQFDTFYQKGQGLVLFGMVGTGKSFYAACLVNAVLDLNMRQAVDESAPRYTAYMTNFTREMNELQRGFDARNERLDKLGGYSLLALDDLGAERDSSFAREQVYTIINERCTANRPTIITTNLSLSEMSDCPNIERKRIYDRVLEMCHPVEFKGESRRRAVFKNRYEDMNKLLGL